MGTKVPRAYGRALRPLLHLIIGQYILSSSKNFEILKTVVIDDIDEVLTVCQALRKHLICMITLIPTAMSWGRFCNYPHFIDEESDSQRV